jgi:L-threonylcarbamoyladenylate synthase
MMGTKVVCVDPNEPDESVLDQAAHMIRGGRMVVSAADTIYTVNINATDIAAISKLFRLKGRSPNKPLHVVVSSLEMAERYVELNDQARTLAQQFLPGPLTLVLPRKPTIPDLLVGGLPTLGIRIPNNKISLILAAKADIPYTTTGANLTDGGDVYTVEDVFTQFGSGMEQIDLVLDQGPLIPRSPSTLIDLTQTPPTILREGPIPSDALLSALGYAVD